MKTASERFYMGIPDYVRIETEEGTYPVWTKAGENCVKAEDVIVSFKKNEGNGKYTEDRTQEENAKHTQSGMHEENGKHGENGTHGEDGKTEEIRIRAETSHVRYVKLHWNTELPPRVRILGDAWERGYGDLEWRGISSRRFMPWYFLAASGDTCFAYGVMVRPSAMCYWLMDSSGISLVLDVRCGGTGVELKGRELTAAKIVALKTVGKTTYDTACEFCRIMCTDPILPDHPVYGSNNWYYAYGQSSEEEILADTDYVLELTRGAENPPYMVIDDCWQERRTPEYIGGPWKQGNEKFPDMKALAEKLKAKGVRPGIWLRFLLNQEESIPDEWRISYNGCLDPSHPDVLAYIQEDVKRICGWGYELIKHDFSTYDLFGLWGLEMQPAVTDDGWHFYDKTKTSAEIVKLLYQAILDASKETDTLILGCNTIGHLGAGLMHMNRTGDDTSGKNWERTRRMGVNTLAFRLPQHHTFYDVDADCVGIMGTIPWRQNRQWADAVAKSGTSLFVSAKPGVLNEEEKEELRQIMCEASEQKEHYIPVDWEDTDCPEIWTNHQETIRYHWYDQEDDLPKSRLHQKYYAQVPMS